MIPLYEYIISKDNISDVSRLNKELNNGFDIIKKMLEEEIVKFDFQVREMRTGNIELITKNYKTKNDDLLGQRFVFYIESNPMTLRRQPLVNGWNIKEWDNHPRKMGEFKTIKEMCDYFKNWVNKKLI
jgi:hypothetical protein